MASISGERGLQRAVDHSNAVHHGWSDKAYDFILQNKGALPRFSVFEVRQLADRLGFVRPVSQQAWGHPVKRLARDGLIQRAGDTNAPDDMHGTIVRRWKWVD